MSLTISTFLEEGDWNKPKAPKKDALVLSGLKTDSQRYFIHHHSEIDTFDAINKRELELGAATIAAIIFLTDHIGFE